MTDTLALYRALADFGEALRASCPHNDCTIYRNTYEMYCEAYEDYKRIKETLPGIHDVTIRALESSIRKRESQVLILV